MARERRRGTMVFWQVLVVQCRDFAIRECCLAIVVPVVVLRMVGGIQHNIICHGDARCSGCRKREERFVFCIIVVRVGGVYSMIVWWWTF